MGDLLDKQLQYFLENEEMLIEKYNGQFIVIHDQQLVHHDKRHHLGANDPCIPAAVTLQMAIFYENVDRLVYRRSAHVQLGRDSLFTEKTTARFMNVEIQKVL